MNLTVDQMDVLNFRLSEVSLELLGNHFYDIFGRKCDTLGSLHLSRSGQTTNELVANSDLVAALKVEDIFKNLVGAPDETQRGNVRNGVRETEEKTGTSCDESVSESNESDEPGYVDSGEQDRLTELKISKILNDVETEYTRLLMCSESTKMKYFITNKHRMETDYEDEFEICSRYHVQENAELMAQSDAFIKLMKYIKCDDRNEFRMGEIAATILKVKDHLSDSVSQS